MNFDDIKDQLKDRFEELKSGLEDSPLFNNLKERYENLSTSAQKSLIWSFVVFTSLLLFSCPIAYWSASSDNIAKYESIRDMIRDLLRTSHMANQLGQSVEPLSTDGLQASIQSKLSDVSLLPEQKAGIQTIDVNTLGAPLAPGDILQEAVQVNLKKLNLKQVVDLGHRLQGIHPSVKLAAMDIVATVENDHYFDVVFKLIKFSLPIDAEEESKDKSDE